MCVDVAWSQQNEQYRKGAQTVKTGGEASMDNSGEGRARHGGEVVAIGQLVFLSLWSSLTSSVVLDSSILGNSCTAELAISEEYGAGE